MIHYYDAVIAKEYGVLEALLLQDFYYWHNYNVSNNSNYYDGMYWTYNTRRAYRDRFFEFSESSIFRSLKKLEENGLIVAGNYNKIKFDRTKWYALTNKAISIFQNEQSDCVKSQNGLCQIEQSDCVKSNNQIVSNRTIRLCQSEQTIPNNISNNNTNNNTNKDSGSDEPQEKKRKRFIPPSLDEVKTYCEERKNGIDAESFIDFYSSKNWMVGKNKMTDWKASVRTWERRNGKQSKKIVEDDGKETTPEEFEKMLFGD